ncbi:MAG: endonuclease/exonuclease/phosphatase family metal-dependent hydrolase [Planctomycetota bacterium]
MIDMQSRTFPVRAMRLNLRILRYLAALLFCAPLGLAQVQALDLPAKIAVPEGVDLAQSFTLRMLVRCEGVPPSDLPSLAANKAWESGAVRDYTTNNSFGMGRESGSQAGFAISVLPDGAWTWNAGDGSSRIDHRPEAADQGIVDGRWHEIGFAVDRSMGVVHLYHDGRRVALHDLQGVGSLKSAMDFVQVENVKGFEVADVRIEPGVIRWEAVAESFTTRLGEERRPASVVEWDGRPLKVLAWNIWHGGRRKGTDEGLKRVVEVIESSGADIVLMQETYGSGPIISGRLGFDYYLRSSNLSVLSRYPIRDVHRLYQGFRFGGVTVELSPDVFVQAYSLWIHYLPDVGKALEEGATPEDLVLGDAKTRGSEIDALLHDLQLHVDASPAVPVLIGGDFNSGSHLDWTQQTAHLDNHYGHIVPWPVSRSMQRARYVDTFRSIHPDPVTAPGHTWSPEFVNSHPDRIDYVYASEGDWKVVDSRVLAQHKRGWPSDHAAVLSTLELVDPAPALKVMSYNIHYGDGMDEKYDLERIAAIISAESPDLVGLQEIGNKQMADELARLTGMSAVFGSAKGSDASYGDAILSTHPFKWVGNVELPTASSSHYQAMAADVDLSALYGPGAVVRFINTHFDWMDSIGSQQSRRASVDVIERNLCGELPSLAILTGDLNTIPGSPPLLDLRSAGWHLPQLGRPMATHGAPNSSKQIDYVLVRPRKNWRVLDVRVLDEPVASDHYPVVLTARPVR